MEVKEIAKAKLLRDEAKEKLATMEDSSSEATLATERNLSQPSNTYRGGKLNHNNMQSA